MHLLYAKFHADIASIGCHDGYGEPSANGNFHWLHHAKFECNYGVPFPFCFDTMFGTYVDYDEFVANGKKIHDTKQSSKLADLGDEKVD